MAVELRLALESRLAIDLPLVSLAEGTSVASIAAQFATAPVPASEAAEIAAVTSRHEAFDAVTSQTIGTRAAPRTAAAD